MKKIYTVMALLIAVTALFSGCQDDKASSNSTDSTSKASQSSQSDTQSAAAEKGESLSFGESELPFATVYKDGDEFEGAWKIVDGTGSQFEHFAFCFNGGGKGAIAIDNTGYYAKYEIKEDDGKKTFTSQMLFGINGEYTYAVSDDNSKITLTKTDDNSTLTMQKIKNFNCKPDLSNSKADENLVGAWKSEDEEYFYFDESGLMYQNQYNTMFTYAAYTADGSVLTAKYSMEGEMSDEYEYTVDGDRLTLNGFSYERIETDELL